MGERDAIPVNVGRVGDRARHADRVTIGLQDVADVLRLREAAVGGWRLSDLASKQRTSRQAEHVNADRRITDVGVADDGTRLLVALPKADSQLVAAAGDTSGGVSGLVERRAAETRLELGLRHQSPRAIVLSWLAANPHEIPQFLAHRARQHDPHAGVARVGRVEVATPPGVALHVEGSAAGSGREGGIHLAVHRAEQHVAGGVEQLHHRIEGGAGLVEVDPHLRAGIAEKCVDVDVGRVVGRHEAVHLEAEPPGFVARLLLGGLPGVGDRGKVRRQHAESLRLGHRGVGFDARRERFLGLDVDRHVAVVGHRQELEASPVARLRCRLAVVARIDDGRAERTQAGPDRVVGE